MSKLKNFIRNNLLSAIIGGLIFGASGVIADTLVESNDVNYNDTSDVKTAVDDLYRVAGIHVEDIESELMLKIYPVGSIYTSISSTSPATLFGGTWERFGKGKTLVSVDENDSDFNTVEKLGGSKTKTIAVGNLPAHSHSVNINSNSVGNHNHTANTSSAGGHNHTANTSSAGGHNHTGTTSTNGNHNHTVSDQYSSGGSYLSPSGNYYGFFYQWTTRTVTSSTNGNHNHTFTTSTNGAHTHSLTTTTNGAHTHSLTTTTTGAHTHNVNGNTENTGSGTALNTQDPYITVYMWKRTA